MENKKEVLIVSGAGVVLIAAALLIFAVPALAGGATNGVQAASGCIVTDAQGNVSCPMANGAAQDTPVDPNISGGSCH